MPKSFLLTNKRYHNKLHSRRKEQRTQQDEAWRHPEKMGWLANMYSMMPAVAQAKSYHDYNTLVTLATSYQQASITNANSSIYSEFSPRKSEVTDRSIEEPIDLTVKKTVDSHKMSVNNHLPVKLTSISPNTNDNSPAVNSSKEGHLQTNRESDIQTAEAEPSYLDENLNSPEEKSDGQHDCVDCGKRYSTSSNLARHRQVHRSMSGNKARACPQCKKVYVSMPAFSMHVRTHSQCCVCKICGKSFSRPWLLQGHLRTHTGEKPFSCNKCGKAFADKSNLRAHIQTHSSEKIFKCERCGKTFALKSYLYKHEETSCSKGDRKNK